MLYWLSHAVNLTMQMFEEKICILVSNFKFINKNGSRNGEDIYRYFNLRCLKKQHKSELIKYDTPEYTRLPSVIFLPIEPLWDKYSNSWRHATICKPRWPTERHVLFREGFSLLIFSMFFWKSGIYIGVNIPEDYCIL